MKLTQNHRSVLALVFVALFLVTGKLFIWKSDEKNPIQNAENPISEQQTPEVQTTSIVTFTTETTTETTTTVTTTESTSPNHFETYPPDLFTDAFAGSDAAALTDLAQTETETTTATTAAETEAPVTTAAAPAAATADYFNDALFIGDSRMVGLGCFAPIEGATYFGTVGLSTYKIDEARSTIEGTKDQSFAQVISGKQYGKVYIMLGINEIGMNFTQTMQNMDNIISRIRTAQPNARIILLANLHVSASRHYSDAVVNNTKINEFNALLAAKADNQTIFYFDVNPYFDDAQGCLNEEYTSDNTHPYAKYYVEWSEWIKQNAIVN